MKIDCLKIENSWIREARSWIAQKVLKLQDMKNNWKYLNKPCTLFKRKKYWKWYKKKSNVANS